MNISGYYTLYALFAPDTGSLDIFIVMLQLDR